MSLARFDKIEPSRRQRLLQAAAQEFASQGFEKASLGRMAEGAGLSKAALYYYFEDKADLFVTVVGAAWERFSPEGRLPPLASLDAWSFWPALEALCDADVASYREAPWLVAAATLVYPSPGEPAGGVAEPFARARAFLRDLLHRGQELDVVRKDLPEDLLIAMLTAVAAAAGRWRADHGETLGADEAERFARVVFGAIRAMLSPGLPGRSGG